MPMQRFNSVSSISRKYLVKPQSIDDVCYTLYRMFKDRAASIAYEKPLCNHMFIIGSNYEVRLFINSLREVQLTVVINIGEPFSSASVKSIQRMFNDIDNVFSKYSEVVGEVLVALRAAIKVKRVTLTAIERILRDVGVAIDARETHSVSDIDIAVLRGRIIGKNLRHYAITITLLYDDMDTEMNFAIEAEVGDEDISGHVVELQNILYSVIEHVVLSLSIDDVEVHPF